MMKTLGIGNRQSGFGSRDLAFASRGSGFARLVAHAAVLTVVVSGFSRTVAAQTVDGAKVYADNCASCHDQPTGRTPPKDALKDRTADAIHLSLTSGTMSMQGVSLSAAEKKAVSEYLSGNTLGAASAQGAGVCAAKPAPFGNLAGKPQWNGWGADADNSRYQPKPGMTAADVPNLKLKWAFGFPGATQA